MCTRSEAHRHVKRNRLFSRTSGSIQCLRSTAFCVVSDSFNHLPTDSVPSVITGYVKAVDDHTVFVQFRQQHDFADNRIAVKRTISDVLSRKDLGCFFPLPLRRPCFGKGIILQNKFAVFNAVTPLLYSSFSVLSSYSNGSQSRTFFIWLSQKSQSWP